MTLLIAIVVLLFLLSITDLIVGVSNDAVNFLNSAIGSRVAPFRTIIIIAAAGVILGSIFSSGIMEVARKGVFHPEFFTLDKILWVFLAVMLTDIVLLDIFNTLGLPTSTTVSIIFELLGASLVAGILFSIEKHEPVSEMFKYINADSVLSIITGIFLSILIAFTAGIIVQYICRLFFTFNYEEKLNRYGAIFAGFGITAIVYFLLLKGLKGTTLLSAAATDFILGHTWLILGVLFIAGIVISRLLQVTMKVNPLKMVVLIGTFSLAMAFAGNDLVNFIGVPISGFLAFENWRNTGAGIAPGEAYQDYLASSDVIVPNYMLLGAGVIMALTLWLSAKARKVTETEVSLGSQSEDGEERFQPNAVARSIVKSSMIVGNLFSVIMPKSMINYYNISFKKRKIRQATVVQDRPAFDMLRAAVNLVLASALIAFATSLKLPLSTTYVSFMVAMGTSLADKAWGRETAVYRVAGVLSVIGGWFITALIAFCAAGIFVAILIKGGTIGAIILICVVAVFIILSQVNFSKKEKVLKEASSRLNLLPQSDIEVFRGNKKIVLEDLTVQFQLYESTLEGLKNYDATEIEVNYDKLKDIQQYGFKLKAQSIRHIKNLQTPDPAAAQILLFSADLLQDITHSSMTMTEECLHYVKNMHHKPSENFIRVTDTLREKMKGFFNKALRALREDDFTHIEDLKVARDDTREYINMQLNNQVKYILKEKPATKQAILESNILLQSRDLLAVTLRILKMYRKYVK